MLLKTFLTEKVNHTKRTISKILLFQKKDNYKKSFAGRKYNFFKYSIYKNISIKNYVEYKCKVFFLTEPKLLNIFIEISGI